MQLQSMILNRQQVPTARKFNLMKGLKLCYSESVFKQGIDEINDFFGLYNTHDKLWFYTPYAIIYLICVILKSQI